jgi:acryloyl-coenzyme A reductase
LTGAVGERMRAVVLREFGEPDQLALESVPRPDIRSDELLVRVRACGVCGHDVLARKGRLGGGLPRILGHEIVGRIELVGAGVTRFAPGDRVVLNQRRSCGICRACRAGSPHHCTSGPGFYGEDLPGGYADYVVADALNAVALPDDVSDEQAAALPCGVVTALHALGRLELALAETVAIVGAGGGVGIHAVALARLAGASVIGVTHRAEKLDRVREAGAHVAITARSADLPAAVRSAAGGPVDAVVDCTGIALDAGVRMLRHGGRLAVLGNIDPGELELQIGRLILKEITIFGSSHGTPAELARAVDLIGRRVLAPVVAARFPLVEAAEAHRLMDTGTASGRVVLTHV